MRRSTIGYLKPVELVALLLGLASFYLAVRPCKDLQE